jgi:rhodanese-related sulfurtransferase
LFIVVAVVAFYFTTKLEKKLNPNEILDDTPKPYYKYILTGVVVLLILIPFLPDKKASLLKKVDDTNFILSQNIPMMTIDEFAYRIWDRDKKLIPVDLRSEKEYKQLQLPYSVNVQEFKQLFDKKLYRKINLITNQLVFIANDELTEKKAAYIASQIGYKNIFILKKGMPEFIASYINFVPTKIDEHANKLVRDTYRFREMASKELPKIIEENKPKSVTNDKPKRVLGGC